VLLTDDSLPWSGWVPAERGRALGNVPTTGRHKQDGWYVRCVGAKGYGNLVELASLQHHVARQLGRPVGRLVMVVKSAHVYQTEEAYVRRILAG
jgi:hypothetical protein